MANSWFQFKQFKVEQSQTAMKVGTDGVLLGAWIDVSHANQILDIGTGTGLLALMLAQRKAEAIISAIEIEELAAQQAEENILNSPWSDRIKVFYTSIQDYSKACQTKYDLIISNPPYFSDSYASSSKQKQLARHTDTLSSNELLVSVSDLLLETGLFAVVLPSDNANKFISLAKSYGLFLKRELKVYPNNKKPEKRRLMEFSLEDNQSIVQEALVIEPEVRHQYSDFYKELTKDFYL